MSYLATSAVTLLSVYKLTCKHSENISSKTRTIGKIKDALTVFNKYKKKKDDKIYTYTFINYLLNVLLLMNQIISNFSPLQILIYTKYLENF